MKKLACLLAFVALAACDDGDITVENVDFTQVAGNVCGNIVYKIKTNEAFFFELEDIATALPNDVSPDGVPFTATIGGNNRIYYRSYSGNVTSESICGSVQPPTPVVNEQWTATAGTIEITSAAVKVANTDPAFSGGEIISKYRHTVVFKNVTLEKPSGTQVVETLPYGDVNLDATLLPFNFDGALGQCGSGTIYNVNGSEAIALDIDPELIVSAVTDPGAPRTGLLSSGVNKLTYTLYAGLISSTDLCDGTAPAINQQWLGQDGVSGVSGIIEVTTTSSGPGVYIHEVHLKNVVLARGNSSFKLADDYLMGTLTTS